VEQEEQQFLYELEKKLWTAANKLLPSLDASQYKHVVLGLVFLKYVSDAFDLRREQLKKQLLDENHDYYLDPEDYEFGVEEELEERDYYAEVNVFWVPATSRWQFLQNNNKVVITGELEVFEGSSKKIRSVGQLVDHALEAIEHDNPSSRGCSTSATPSCKLISPSSAN